MERKDDLWQKEFWTQREVAEYFRVTDNTIKNWRKRGLLSFFKAPGSNRVVYYSRDIESLQEKFTTWRKEAGSKPDKIKRVKPKPSSSEDWRIS